VGERFAAVPRVCPGSRVLRGAELIEVDTPNARPIPVFELHLGRHRRPLVGGSSPRPPYQSEALRHRRVATLYFSNLPRVQHKGRGGGAPQPGIFPARVVSRLRGIGRKRREASDTAQSSRRGDPRTTSDVRRFSSERPPGRSIFVPPSSGLDPGQSVRHGTPGTGNDEFFSMAGRPTRRTAFVRIVV